MLKIALVGKKATGKTFVAFYLRRNYGFKMIRIMEGVTKMMRYFYLYRKHERPKWERRIDLYDAIYKVDPEVHINYLLRRLATTTNDVVVDDVRYINELVKLRDEGFTIIRIAAPEIRRRKVGATVRKADKGTLVLQEYYGSDTTAAYSADYAIYNDTKEGTRAAIDKIIEQLDIRG